MAVWPSTISLACTSASIVSNSELRTLVLGELEPVERAWGLYMSAEVCEVWVTRREGARSPRTPGLEADVGGKMGRGSDPGPPTTDPDRRA